MTERKITIPVDVLRASSPLSGEGVEAPVHTDRIIGDHTAGKPFDLNAIAASVAAHRAVSAAVQPPAAPPVGR